MPPQQKLGERVRRLREAMNMTRAELAEAAALTEQIISDLEERNLCPPLGPLQKIARVLHVRLSGFIDEEPARDPVINRCDERNIDLAVQRSVDSPAAFRYHSLAKGKTDRHMEPFFVELSPDAAHETEEPRMSSHQGEEFVLVTSGELRVCYGREVYILGPGDTMYYNSVVPHCLRANGDRIASIYVVLYHPD